MKERKETILPVILGKESKKKILLVILKKQEGQETFKGLNHQSLDQRSLAFTSYVQILFDGVV